MGKENFYRQIEIEKQKIINEKNAAEKKLQEAARQEEINRQREIDRKKQELIEVEKATRTNFAGTDIIETLEEIRDKNILTYKKNNKSVNSGPVRYIFGMAAGGCKYETKTVIEPMKICFDVNSVTAKFNYWIDTSDEYRDFSGSSQIQIIKKENVFEIKYGIGSSESLDITSTEPVDIINGIAKVVALNQSRKK
jgi:hypothetical protein